MQHVWVACGCVTKVQTGCIMYGLEYNDNITKNNPLHRTNGTTVFENGGDNIYAPVGSIRYR